ncbi:GGDEF domain-containing protein [Ferrimonas pelagia]|uniref:diguanylate cyclase n=1 Tax=Ferrimonas pelagia TaxID=1177826 RepID=A0ABP9EPN4_9GAMM
MSHTAPTATTAADHAFRSRVLIGISLTTLLLSGLLGVSNVGRGAAVIYGAVQLGYAGLSGYVCWAAIKQRLPNWVVYLYALTLTGLVLSGTAISSIQAYNVVWALTLPTINYLLFGQRIALPLSLFAFATTLYTLSLKEFTFGTPPFNNLMLSYLLVWGISHSYEANRARNEQQLRRQALTDPLTGIGNRLAMQQTFAELQRAPASAGLALLLIDIDWFKQVNDSFGHEAGDTVLKTLSRRLTQQEPDSALFRIGGEEFCLFMYSDKPATVAARARQLCEVIRATPITTHTGPIPVTISIGVTLSPPEPTLSMLLRDADTQLYVAKGAGRDQISMLGLVETPNSQAAAHQGRRRAHRDQSVSGSSLDATATPARKAGTG